MQVGVAGSVSARRWASGDVELWTAIRSGHEREGDAATNTSILRRPPPTS
jgi:hypothetical protein